MLTPEVSSALNAYGFEGDRAALSRQLDHCVSTAASHGITMSPEGLICIACYLASERGMTHLLRWLRGAWVEFIAGRPVPALRRGDCVDERAWFSFYDRLPSSDLRGNQGHRIIRAIRAAMAASSAPVAVSDPEPIAERVVPIARRVRIKAKPAQEPIQAAPREEAEEPSEVSIEIQIP